jgi:photosystem II stability/assembly factor-like uncharacterized protein
MQKAASSTKIFTTAIVLVLTLWAATPGALQPQARYDSTLFDAMKWRFIGPYRGGRVTAVAGVPSQRYVYFLGATGGGVWKTIDGGMTWDPVADSTTMAGSIGAIAVAPSDPNVVYVGTGEEPPRGNVSPGNGMWKSTDAGKTWSRAGLADAGQIAHVHVHPTNPDLVFVTVLGHIFGPNETRGVFRSTDGGATWEKILSRDEHTGAVNLAVDPSNPRIMYAALWQVRRYPWALESGGPGSGLFKTTDGGDSWTEITRNKGLPEGTVGKIGVTVSGADPNRVWAIVENENGGVFRSDDAGRSWSLVNSERRLRQRAWYYTHIYADPQDRETVYVLNTGFYRSVDGGKTYSSIRVPHGDNHALWIDPNAPNRMINGNDGGANVSYNGGVTWTRQENQPTAQMYHATTTDHFHYMVCGGQQDNSTICVPSRADGGGISIQDYHRVGGCESGYVTHRPDNPDVSYAGCYGGQLERVDRATGQEQSIMVWPENPMGWGADSLKYRFQWTFPIVLSPQDPNMLYVTSQHVHRSTNEGMSWETISPDLTRNDKSKQGPAGGPITKDNTSVEYYNVVFALVPSPHDPNVLWAGTDDGLIHVTRNGGQTWENVTPRDLPEWALISIIDASPHQPGTAYFAATRYKLDDFAPYIYKTTNYGKTWRRVVSGIPGDHFVRVVREDPDRRGLLYAGGEFGVYVSFDDGTSWQSLRLNSPVVPIHNLVVKDKDLVAATHGRGFWILDDLTPLHQLTQEVARSAHHLFQPRDALRLTASSDNSHRMQFAPNPPTGVVLRYYFREQPSEEVTLDILTEDGAVIRSFTGAEGEEEPDPSAAFFGGGQTSNIPTDAGMNQFAFNMRYDGFARFPGMIMWGARRSGPMAVPGTYQARLTVGDWSQTRTFQYRKDPRSVASQADLEEQFAFLMRIRDRVSEANDAVKEIRDIKSQLDGVVKRVTGHAEADTITEAARGLTTRLGSIEAEIYQVKNRSNQDPLNFPIKLNNKLAALATYVDGSDAHPTQQSYAVFDQLSSALQVQLDRLRTILETDVPAFNDFVREKNVPAVLLPTTRPQQAEAGGP